MASINVGGVIEVDARVGLLISSISEYKDVYPVLLQAVQMLVKEFKETKINEKQKARDSKYYRAESEPRVSAFQTQSSSYVFGLVKAGALADAVDAMQMYYDRPELVDEVLRLFLVLLESNRHQALVAAELNRTDLLGALSKIARSSQYQDHAACLHRMVALLTALANASQQANLKQRTLVIGIVGQVMFVSYKDVRLLQACFCCLDASLCSTATDNSARVSIPLSVTNIVLNAMMLCNLHYLELRLDFHKVARRVLYRMLETSSDAASKLPFNTSASLVCHILAKHRKLVDLDQTDVTMVERIIEMPLAETVTSGITKLRDSFTGSGFGITELRDSLLKLALAVLWKENAQNFLSEGGLQLVFQLLSAQEANMDASIRLHAATVLQQFSGTLRDEVWMELQGQQGLATLLEAIQAELAKSDSDDVVDSLVSVVEELLPCDGFAKEFEQADGQNALASILVKRQALPCSAKRCIVLMSKMHELTQRLEITTPSDIGGLICAAQSENGVHQVMQLHCIKALNHVYSHRHSEGFVLATQHIKDLIRLVQSNIQDISLLSAFTNLLVNLLKNQAIRREFIEYGVLQFIARAIYLHQWEMGESSRNANFVVNNVASDSDVRRYNSVLETLANFSAQLSPTDMEPFIDSLELCCSVVAVLATTTSRCQSLVNGNTVSFIVTVLKNAMQSTSAIDQSHFVRIVKSCVYALTGIIRPHWLEYKLSSRQTEPGLDSRITSAMVELSACGGHEVIVRCLERGLLLKYHDSVVFKSSCDLICIIMSTSPSTADAFIRAGWLSIAVSILDARDCQLDDFTATDAVAKSLLLTVIADPQCVAQMIKAGAMKSVLDKMESAIVHRGYFLQESTYVRLVKLLEILATGFAGTHSNRLLARSFRHMRDFLRDSAFSLSPRIESARKHAQEVVKLLATEDVVRRLASRLAGSVSTIERHLETDSSGVGSDVATPSDDDFVALEAILLSSRPKELLKDVVFHRILARLAALASKLSDGNIDIFGVDNSLLQELSCLGSQLLSSSHRESMFASAMAHFSSESNTVKSLIWISLSSEHEDEQAVRFVMEQLIDRYERQDYESLPKLLEALAYQVQKRPTKNAIQRSPRALSLQNILWSIVKSTDADAREGASVRIDLAIAALDVVAALLEELPAGWFPLSSGSGDPHEFVSCCLKMLSICTHENNVTVLLSSGEKHILDKPSDNALFGRIVRSSCIILRACMKLGAEYARVIIHHAATKHLLENYSNASKTDADCSVLHWFLCLVSCLISSHGLLFAEKLLALLTNPVDLLLRASEMVLNNNERDAVLLSWRSFADCVAISSDSMFCNGRQLDDVNQINAVARQAEALYSFDQATEGKLHIDAFIVEKHIEETLAHLTVMLVRWSQDQLSSGVSASKLLNAIDTSAVAHRKLFNFATGYRNAEARVVALHLKLARIAVEYGIREQHDFVLESEATNLHMLTQLDWEDDETLAAYINLASTVFLTSYSSRTLDFLESCSGALLRSAIRLASIDSDHSTQLQRCVDTMLQLLCPLLDEHWEDIGVPRILRLYQAFGIASWSRTIMLSAIFSLYQGVGRLLEMASGPSGENAQQEVVLFLHQNLSELRHKTQRIEEPELGALLAIIHPTSAPRPEEGHLGESDDDKVDLSDGKPSQNVMRATLEVLKDLVRVKHCAIICGSLKGFEILYRVMTSASSHQSSNLLVCLEICCYLTAHEENLQDLMLLPLVKLIFIIVDAHNGLEKYSRLGFLIIDRCISLQAPSFATQSVIQQCRTQILSWKSKSSNVSQVISEEASEAIRKLCEIQTSLAGPLPEAPEPPKPTRFFESPLSIQEVTKSSILSHYSVVKCQVVVDGKTRSNDGFSYVDMKTSVKTFEEPDSYKMLCAAVYQLKFLLHDMNTALDDEYTSPLLVPLCEVVVLHSVTPDLVCHAMEVLAQISFLRPALIINHSAIDFHGLATSCGLHQQESLPFAMFASAFCDNIAAQSHSQGMHVAKSILELVIALLKTWKENSDVVQSCTSALRILLQIVGSAQSRTLHDDDPLAWLNGAFMNHTHDISVTWNCLQCALHLIPGSIDHPSFASQSVEATLAILLEKMRAYSSHPLITECALQAIERIYQRGKRQFVRHQLIDLGAVHLLINCITSHSLNEHIVVPSMRLLLSFLSSSGHFEEVLAQVAMNKGHVVIPTVCRANVNEEQMCVLGTQILMRMIDVQDSNFERHVLLYTVGGSSGHNDDDDKEEAMKESGMEKLRWHDQVLQELLSADILSLLFHLLDNYQTMALNTSEKNGSNGASFVGMLLEMLYDFTRINRGRDLAEELHALEYLQQIVEVVWFQGENQLLLESAIDCLVNLACANRQLHGWSDVPMWLLRVAESVQSKCSLPLCLEKIVGILNRLAVHSDMGNQLAHDGAHLILQLATYAEADSDNDLCLEQSVFTLMCQLCHERHNIRIFILFDAIAISTERISLHIDDEDCLHACIEFLVILARDKESSSALQDEHVYTSLRAVIAKYEHTAKRVYHLARDLAELLRNTASKEQQEALNAAIANSNRSSDDKKSSPAPSLHLSQLELSYRDLLLEGATFRLCLDHSKPKHKQEKTKVRIAAAITGSYLLFQHFSCEPTRMERVYLSQVEVMPSTSGLEAPEGVQSPKKMPKSRIPFLKRAFASTSSAAAALRAGCRFRLVVRGELLTLEATSVDERIMWEQALQWLVLHHADGVFLTK